MSLLKHRGVIALATVVVALLTTRLGVWQLDRAAQKQAWVDAVAAQQNQPPLDETAWGVTTPSMHDMHRRVQLQGQWRGEFTRYLDNRTMGEAAGFLVVTPLLMPNGQQVVVQRGWLPRHRQDRSQLAPIDTPAGLVKVEGVLAPPPSRFFSLGEDGEGPVVQNLEWVAYGRLIQADIGVLSIRQVGPASDGLKRDWNPIDTKISTHYGYAFQWFAMAFATVMLYVWYQIIIPRRQR
jgi:surfeit locus 1 family protein